MYQPYPSSAQMPGVPSQTAPASVRNAVTVMYAGAAASMINMGIMIATRNTTKAALLRHFARLSSGQPHGLGRPLLVGAVIGGLVGATLWIILAQACRKGQNWARITGTVLFGIATIDAIAYQAIPFAAAVKIFVLVIWLFGLNAVALLWRNSSSAYFRGVPS